MHDVWMLQGCCERPGRITTAHGAFNERVSVDLIGPLHRTDRGNEYTVVMQDHFTKWIGDAAVATKEAMLVADVIVHEWVYKHGTPLNLHSNRGTEFTAAMHQCLCDLLRIHKTHKMQSHVMGHAENCGVGATERLGRPPTCCSVCLQIDLACLYRSQPPQNGLWSRDDTSLRSDAG